MNQEEKKTGQVKSKAVGWRIPEPLRRGLNSHAEYLSIENETPTDAMVALWLQERLRVEERARALRTLGIGEKELHKH
jgi:hypothetical protein